jgi:hypothetical protein
MKTIKIPLAFYYVLLTLISLVSCQDDSEYLNEYLLNDVSTISQTNRKNIYNEINNLRKAKKIDVKVLFFEKSSNVSIEERTINFLNSKKDIVNKNMMLISVCLESREISFKSFSRTINNIESEKMNSYFKSIKIHSENKEIVESLPFVISEIKNLL